MQGNESAVPMLDKENPIDYTVLVGEQLVQYGEQNKWMKRAL
jgi:hypothetical protein